MRKNINRGRLTGVSLKSFSLFIAFFRRKPAIINPIKAFIGAGATPIKKGNAIIDQ
jgi:hypothetical protein